MCAPVEAHLWLLTFMLFIVRPSWACSRGRAARSFVSLKLIYFRHDSKCRWGQCRLCPHWHRIYPFPFLASFHSWPCLVYHHGRPRFASHLMLWLCCCCSQSPAVPLGALHLRWFHSTTMWSPTRVPPITAVSQEAVDGTSELTALLSSRYFLSLLCGTNSSALSAESGDLQASHFCARSLRLTCSHFLIR